MYFNITLLFVVQILLQNWCYAAGRGPTNSAISNSMMYAYSEVCTWAAMASADGEGLGDTTSVLTAVP